MLPNQLLCLQGMGNPGNAAHQSGLAGEEQEEKAKQAWPHGVSTTQTTPLGWISGR